MNAEDPTIGADGEPVTHDTYPPGTVELYERVDALIRAEYGNRIGAETARGRIQLQRVVSRIVVAARLALRGEG